MMTFLTGTSKSKREWSKKDCVVRARRRGDAGGNGGTEWTPLFGADGEHAKEICEAVAEALLVGLKAFAPAARADRITVQVACREEGSSSYWHLDRGTPVQQLALFNGGIDDE